MEPTVILTLIVTACLAVFSSITAPIILSHRTERMHREDLLEQYRREDELAAKLAEAARQATRRDTQTNIKLDEIHTLVNSEMTAARQAQLTIAQAMLVVLQRVVATAYSKGQDPDPEDLAAIEATKESIDELKGILADRMVQFDRATQDREDAEAAAEVAAAADAAAAAAAATAGEAE